MGFEKHKKAIEHLATQVSTLSEDYRFTPVLLATSKYVYNEFFQLDENKHGNFLKDSLSAIYNEDDSSEPNDKADEKNTFPCFEDIRINYVDVFHNGLHIKRVPCEPNAVGLELEDIKYEYVITIPSCFKKIDGKRIKEEENIPVDGGNIKLSATFFEHLGMKNGGKFYLEIAVFHEACHMICDFIKESIDNNNNKVFTYKDGKPLLDKVLANENGNLEEEIFCTAFAKVVAKKSKIF
jgi:hypothetical protein